jgi:sterol 24-C-methyltransferase
LATLPDEDKQACIDAYKFFQRMQDGKETETEDEKAKITDLNWRIVAEKPHTQTV